MSSRMIRDGFPLLDRQYPAAALQAADRPGNGFLEVAHVDLGLAPACRVERSLIDDVGEVSPSKSRRPGGNRPEVHILRQHEVLRVNPQNLLPPSNVRSVERDVTIEAAGPQERRIE